MHYLTMKLELLSGKVSIRKWVFFSRLEYAFATLRIAKENECQTRNINLSLSPQRIVYKGEYEYTQRYGTILRVVSVEVRQ